MKGQLETAFTTVKLCRMAMTKPARLLPGIAANHYLIFFGDNANLKLTTRNEWINYEC